MPWQEVSNQPPPFPTIVKDPNDRYDLDEDDPPNLPLLLLLLPMVILQERMGTINPAAEEEVLVKADENQDGVEVEVKAKVPRNDLVHDWLMLLLLLLLHLLLPERKVTN